MASVTSLYVHVPFCRHLCDYCDFYKMRLEGGTAQLRQFEDYLTSSWKRHESILLEHGQTWGPLETLYLGGGTPSLWGLQGAEFLAGLFEGQISWNRGYEATMEIDPGSWDEVGLLAWEKFGINRYSVGTQSLNPHFLKVLDRAHDVEQTLTLLHRLKGKNFSVDFLLGAPQSEERNRNILEELSALLEYGPSHVSLYILHPNKGYLKHHQMPPDEWIRKEYLTVSAYLRSRGFHHYEVSNFALNQKESKHNLRYWLGESVGALGPTGTGYFAISEEQAWRYKWKPGRAEIEPEHLGSSEMQLEKLYTRLRLSQAFQAAELVPQSCIESFEELLLHWENTGLVEAKVGNQWKMRPEGWVILDTLMGQIFQALPAL